VMVERFVAKVLKGGKVTIPVRVRELLGIRNGDYVRMEVIKVIGGADRETEGSQRL